jgi:hypothetical protein
MIRVGVGCKMKIVKNGKIAHKIADEIFLECP